MNFTPAFWAAARIVVSASGAGLSARGGCRDSGTSGISGLEGGDACSGRAAGSSIPCGTATPIAWSCSKMEAQESDPMAYSSVRFSSLRQDRHATRAGPVGPVVLPPFLQTFGGTDGWDRWDHHERLPIRAGSTSPAHAGPTG